MLQLRSRSKRRSSPKLIQILTNHRRDVLSTDSLALLTKIGMQSGTNSAVNNGGVWLGNDGPYTNDFTNNSTEPIILAIWGPAGSWVNAI